MITEESIREKVNKALVRYSEWRVGDVTVTKSDPRDDVGLIVCIPLPEMKKGRYITIEAIDVTDTMIGDLLYHEAKRLGYKIDAFASADRKLRGAPGVGPDPRTGVMSLLFNFSGDSGLLDR